MRPSFFAGYVLLFSSSFYTASFSAVAWPDLGAGLRLVYAPATPARLLSFICLFAIFIFTHIIAFNAGRLGSTSSHVWGRGTVLARALRSPFGHVRLLFSVRPAACGCLLSRAGVWSRL